MKQYNPNKSEQISQKLSEAEAHLEAGKTIQEICELLAVSRATYHRWKSRYGGLGEMDMQRVSFLEEENARLKKEVDELSLQVRVLEETLRGKF